MDHRANPVTTPATSHGGELPRGPGSPRLVRPFRLVSSCYWRYWSWPGWPGFWSSPCPTSQGVGHDCAGVLALEGVSRGRSGDDLSRVADRPGGAGTEPRREPARAVAHRGGGRAHRAGGTWPGRAGPGRLAAARACGRGSAWPSTSASAPRAWACSRCLPARRPARSLDLPDRPGRDRHGRAGRLEALADRAAAARGSASLSCPS